MALLSFCRGPWSHRHLKRAQKDHKNTRGKELPTNYGDLGLSLEPKTSSLKHTETSAQFWKQHTKVTVYILGGP